MVELNLYQISEVCRRDIKTAPQSEVADMTEQFNHCISIDTEGPVHSSSVGNGYVVVTCDKFTQNVKPKPTPQSNFETAADFYL